MKQDKNQDRKVVSDQDFDLFFRTALEDHKVEPNPTNWKSLQQWGAITFFLGISKSKVFQIAATVLFIVLATSLIGRFNQEIISKDLAIEAVEPVVEQETPTPLPPVSDAEPQDFVLDIEDEELDQDVRKEIIETELDEYLAFLLNDEHEFAEQIDSAEISKYLEPVKQLPIDEMFAHIPDLEQEEITILAPLETKITLPHRFIEHEEDIEIYLLLYEINEYQSQ